MVDFPKIRKVYIKNFRSISEVEFDASDFTILVGDNDCGKSNVFRALNLFFNGETNPGEKFDFETDYNKFAPVVAKKAKEILVRITFDMPDNYQDSSGERLEWTKRWRSDGLQERQSYIGLDYKEWERKSGSRWVRRQSPPKRTSKSYSLLRLINFEYIPAIRSPLFLRKLRGRIYEAIAASEESNFRKNSQTFEKSIGKTLSDLTDVLKGKLSDDTTLRLPNDLSDLFESLDFLSGDKSISLGNRGDGIKARYIPFLLQFISDKLYEANSRRTFIWAYEEPENNLEFNKSRELAVDLIELASEEEIQLFVTTHSPVFYNLYSSHGELCEAYHLSKSDSQEGTVCVHTDKLSDHLDEHMGTMSLIAPHVAKFTEEMDQLKSANETLIDKLEKTNPNNLPVIFVEGLTDHKLLTSLTKKFRGKLFDLIHFARPMNPGGANYVCNSLMSFEFGSKTQSSSTRGKCLGLLDADEEAESALGRLPIKEGKLKHSHVLFLGVPTHLISPTNMGFKFPISLEELLHPSIWEYAKSNGWLRPRTKDISSKELLDFMRLSDQKFSDIIEPSWEVFSTYEVNPDCKGALVNYVVSLPKDEIEKACTEHLQVLDRIAAELKLCMPGIKLI